MNRILIMAALAVMAFAPAAAQSANTTAGAEITPPLQLFSWEDLEFGRIAPDAVLAGAVSVDASNTRVCTGGATCLGEGALAGKFKAMGEPDRLYIISAPADVTLSNGAGASMTMRDVAADRAGGVLTGGVDEFYVTGVLDVAAGQAPGRYTGAYTVSIEYQ